MFALLIMAASIVATLAAGLFLSIDLGRDAAQSIAEPSQNGPSLS